MKLKAAGLNPDAVIVALGSNDVAMESKIKVYEKIIRDLMDTIGNVPVTWLTINRRDTKRIHARSVIFNSVLIKLTAEYPNLVLSDWYSVINSNLKLMAWDKVHLTPTGYTVRAKSYQSLARDIYERYWIATTATTTTTDVDTTTTTVAPIGPAVTTTLPTDTSTTAPTTSTTVKTTP